MTRSAATHAIARRAEPRRTRDIAPRSELLARLEGAVLDTLSRAKPGKVSAGKRLVGLARPNPLIEEALRKSTEAHVAALRRAGLDTSVIDLLRSWVEVTVDARALQRQIEVQRALGSLQAEPALLAPQAPSEDPAAPLSAAELGQALGGLGDETVRQRERAGLLFSVLRPGRKRGREYPAFQAWPGISGEPLERSLSALGAVGGTVAYGFFTSPTDLLGGLTPIETLVGRPTAPRDMEESTKALLSASAAQRLQAVEKAAHAHAAVFAA